MAVRSVLESLAISYTCIELGRVQLTTGLNVSDLDRLRISLQHYELELMENSKKALVEQIKISIVELLHSSDGEGALKLSVYLSKKFHHDYTFLSNVFSSEEGSTIERFYIFNKVKRIKELLVYDHLTVKEISFQLNYSSDAHLCSQFKKFTGVTPTMFKKKWESEQCAL
ncbi:AraC family transcriptional regulator [Pseudoflavitalea sp. G-6-1-2]|uniref:helix-turn-helix domain-containing protein n=1 Tax=Pseudoflavitalea sp. G-6-1-2 TaxID=2728841 RepID=UPI001F0F357A|nr:AraC family transcriptional regulator [Pseudoflavitalea sp. G-6-1-2]